LSLGKLRTPQDEPFIRERTDYSVRAKIAHFIHLYEANLSRAAIDYAQHLLSFTLPTPDTVGEIVVEARGMAKTSKSGSDQTRNYQPPT
jgi:hypothetical protein